MSMDIGCKGQKTLALVTIASLGGMSHSWGKLSATHLLIASLDVSVEVA